MMKIKIQKWDAGLAIRLPDELAEHFSVGDEAELSLVNGALVIGAMHPLETEYRLEDLLAQVTDDNRHGEI